MCEIGLLFNCNLFLFSTLWVFLICLLSSLKLAIVENKHEHISYIYLLVNLYFVVTVL